MLDSPRPRRPLIWVVDDSPTEAAITVRSLGDAYNYERFADGSLVVERLAAGAGRPDLILLDWVMPGMTGDQVCRFLRTRRDTRDLPIIIVTTSRLDTEHVVLGLASGANDYVPRPFAPEELRARVDAALRAQELAQLANRERQRLTTVNNLGHALFQTIASVEQAIAQLATALTATLCDGCTVLILPGATDTVAESRHRDPAAAAALVEISTVADPVILAFASSADARSQLPPAYASYIDRFGLHGLAILPFPTREPIRGVVTVTRERGREPFDADDIATIETCIEYTSLAIERLIRFDAERAARAQLDAVLEGLPIGILATDERGALTLVNSAAAAMVADIRTARTLADVFSQPRWAAADGSPLTDTANMLGGGDARLPVDVELRLTVAGEPEPRTVALSVVPLRARANAVVGSVTVLEDVSAERAISIERERIGKFQQDMIAIVGHDLRSPLSAIYAAVDILTVVHPAAADAQVARTVARMRSSCTRMTRIIEQLLDVTHARLGGGIPLARTHVSLSALARAIVDEQRGSRPNTTFELVAPEEVNGFWDPDRLEQVISNLIGNAVQYGRRDEPITVTVTRADANAVLTVRNAIRTAPIPPELCAVLFEPYQRGEATTKGSGLGLGLYIVKAIVSAHRGTIDVSSNADGTVFRFVLPLGDD